METTPELETSRQYSRLGLGMLQPVRHPHLAIHGRRGGEVLLRLLALAGAPVELAEAKASRAFLVPITPRA
jgi:hypothetical protein